MKIVYIKRAAIAATALAAVLSPPPAAAAARSRPAPQRRRRRWRQQRLHVRDDHPRDPGRHVLGPDPRRRRAGGQGHRLDAEVLGRPGRDQAGHPDRQGAVNSKVDGIASTLVTPDALIPSLKKAEAAGIPVDTFNSGLDYYQQAGSIAHFSSDEKLAGQQAGAKAKAAGGDQDPLHHPADRLGRARGPVRGRQGQLPEHREPPGERRRRLRRHLGDPGQAEPGQGHQLGDHPRCRRRPWTPSRPRRRRAERRQGRHLRPQRRRRQGGPGRDAAVLHRPAALPAGLPGDRRSCTSTRRTATSWVAARPR